MEKKKKTPIPGEDILKGDTYLRLYFKVIESSLTPASKLILCYLYSWHTQSRVIVLSNLSISRRLNINPSSVKRSKAELSQLGLVKITSDPGKHETSTYEIDTDELARFLGVEKKGTCRNKDLKAPRTGGYMKNKQ